MTLRLCAMGGLALALFSSVAASHTTVSNGALAVEIPCDAPKFCVGDGGVCKRPATGLVIWCPLPPGAIPKAGAPDPTRSFDLTVAGCRSPHVTKTGGRYKVACDSVVPVQ
jgi:hypothetical protein